MITVLINRKNNIENSHIYFFLLIDVLKQNKWLKIGVTYAGDPQAQRKQQRTKRLV